MTKEFKGYPLFNDVTDDLLRAWNRFNIGLNIMETLGEDDAEAYMLQFSDLDVKQVELLALMATIHGHEEVQKQVMEIMELEDGTDKESSGDTDEVSESSTDVVEG